MGTERPDSPAPPPPSFHPVWREESLKSLLRKIHLLQEKASLRCSLECVLWTFRHQRISFQQMGLRYLLILLYLVPDTLKCRILYFVARCSQDHELGV